MTKNDEEHEKKGTPARGRIMQVVEVEEDDASSQKVDLPVPSQVVSDESVLSEDEAMIPAVSHTFDPQVSKKEEKPDIAGSFPMGDMDEIESNDSKETSHINSEEQDKKYITPLNVSEKRDIVSELFDTKEKTIPYPDISLDKKRSRFGFGLWIIILLSIVGLIGAGLIFLNQGSKNQEPVTNVVPIATPTPIELMTDTPSASNSGESPTPGSDASTSAKITKVGLTVQVLNGSGTSGVASVVKKYLEEKGYTVVSTGNAKNFDYEKTDILIKSTKKSFLEKLISDLSEKYVLGSTSAVLDAGASYDAQVIIGKE